MTDLPKNPTPEGLMLIEAVENQIKSGDPTETTKTLERLIALGEDRENAIKYISNALAVEVFGALKHSQEYDEERYIKNLKQLPDLSFLDD